MQKKRDRVRSLVQAGQKKPVPVKIDGSVRQVHRATINSVHDLLALQRLQLHSCRRLDLGALQKDLLRHCPRLHTLHITGDMVDHAQHRIHFRMPQLRELHLAWPGAYVHFSELHLHCAQLQRLRLQGMRGFAHFTGDWLLPRSLRHLELDYDMSTHELAQLVPQLQGLTHLQWSNHQARCVQLQLPSLVHLAYCVSRPNLELDLRHCPQLHGLQLTTEFPRNQLERLRLPSPTPRVGVSRPNLVQRGLPAVVEHV